MGPIPKTEGMKFFHEEVSFVIEKTKGLFDQVGSSYFKFKIALNLAKISITTN